ncbi:hypothetical protein MIZ01_1779 [Sideroxyarcus emersonii]|uniref:Uncharacterized protein n=1 Tax=Sideroxyarcus emersonii TaxID=2764705 RepID=A0AAN2BZN5_9PROT|nr:hypothetical protein [Sideroxyarcus emersonii]BCK87982.1 hypothetical protein MIZ01_1779 [Sideroxyarcus emersonii]
MMQEHFSRSGLTPGAGRSKASRLNVVALVAVATMILALFSPTALQAAEEMPGQAGEFLSGWLDGVSRTQEIQPHWELLLGMNSPRLTQGFRYNYSRQYLPGNSIAENYGMGKGLELIMSENFEAQIGIPAYIDKQAPRSNSSGWADETFLGRYRLMAANEENGNYVVSCSLGLSVPTGSDQFSSHSTVYTPAFAAGKGWGNRQQGFDIQSSISASVPDHNLSLIGVPVAWAVALQAHVLQNFWPEIEANYTHWYKGAFDGKNQLVLTYGVVFGRFELKGREKLTVGIGYQEPRGTSFSTFNRGWISTLKLSF